MKRHKILSKILQVTKFTTLLAAVLVICSCSIFHKQAGSNVEDKEFAKLPMEQKYTELKKELEKQKVEWNTQKPALSRLVANEKDLNFLIEQLSNMSHVDNQPSRQQFQGSGPDSNSKIADVSAGDKTAKLQSDNGKMVTDSSKANLATSKKISAESSESIVSSLRKLAGSDANLASLLMQLKQLADTLKQQQRESIVTGDSSVPTSILFANSKIQLTDYADQLVGKMAQGNAILGKRVGIASFVVFDNNLRTTNPLGNQLAEAMYAQLAEKGVRVVDYKLTRQIAVTDKGDLAFSRDLNDLKDVTGMNYVLTGTIVKTRRGAVVNSRIVSTKDNTVIAAASTLMPKGILQQMHLWL